MGTCLVKNILKVVGSDQVLCYVCKMLALLHGTVATLHIELQCNIHRLLSVPGRFWRVQCMGVMNLKRPTAITGTKTHANTSFSTEICSGAIISLFQYLVLIQVCWPTAQKGPLRCLAADKSMLKIWPRVNCSCPWYQSVSVGQCGGGSAASCAFKKWLLLVGLV
jgi:hypothetical protein